MRDRWYYLTFVCLAAAFLITLFVCMERRYRRGEEFINWLVKENDLKRAIEQGYPPHDLVGCDSGRLLAALIRKYKLGGVGFLLRQLDSGDNARTALALSELQHLFFSYIAPYGDYEKVLSERGLDKARRMVSAWENEIAQLAVSQSPVVRENAAILLGLTGERSAALRLKEIADSDRPVAIRANAVEAFFHLPARLRNRSVPERLPVREVQNWTESYLSDREPEIRLAALRALGRSERDHQLLKEAQKDKDIRVRTEAAWLLCRTHWQYDRKILLSAVDSSLVDNCTRFGIATYLAREGEKSVLSVIAQLINNPEITEPWGIDVVCHYALASETISQFTGNDYGHPGDHESFEDFGERVKADALDWWERHKDEVLRESKDSDSRSR